VHVSDVARAFALAAQTPAANGLSVNVGSGTALSVSALADMVGGERVAAAARVNDLRATLASTCRAKEVLGFETTRDFRDALKREMEAEEAFSFSTTSREEEEEEGASGRRPRGASARAPAPAVAD
jgi:nucleoside-diphosphate-sugar epimerase